MFTVPNNQINKYYHLVLLLNFLCATILDFMMSYGCPTVMYTKDLLLYDNSGNKVTSQKPKWRPVENLTTLISNFFQLYLKLSFSCFPKKFDFSLYFQQFNLNLLKEWWFPLLHYIILTPFCFCVLLLCKKKNTSILPESESSMFDFYERKKS